MGLFLIFLLCAAAAAAAVILCGGSAVLAVVCFVLAFAAAHLLYVVAVYLLTRGTDLSKEGARPNRIAQRACGRAMRLLLFYGGARVSLIGLEKLPKDRRFLFVCNHRSLFDPIIVMGRLEAYSIAFISKPSNLRIPLAGPVVATAGYLAIDRENDREALKTILQAADYMKRDLCSIGIYPEGTRSRTGELLPFHKGSFKAAQRAKVPLAIACVRGTEQLRHGFFLHPHKVELEILELLPAESVAAMSTQELAVHSRELIEAGLEKGGGET